ncbi:aminodeoxychorismate synthase component I [Rubritalea marina]|uniref:aminodeoxychorismate synthase component I n=1 Tax=Rubritalea marina TaxID=361055 RepID=UPI0003798952|nr:aminodeoxychorismate synthase component I [Rubritalea marina]
MPSRLQAISLKHSPIAVAHALQHLDGLVFFDSAGNIQSDRGGALSIITARPRKVFRGHISDTSELESHLQEHAQSDHPLPHGGLCGWVEYEGNYCFGAYHEMLVYRHSDQQWFESGALSTQLETEHSSPSALGFGPFTPSISKTEYMAKVGRIADYIAAGDIYQVNLSQKFSAQTMPSNNSKLFTLYQQLRELSPAPHAAYLNLDNHEILSSSPETFLKLHNQSIETRPIKGTRPRFQDPKQDAASAHELQHSEKEISELIMITDLLRNDLGTVCEFGSVKVDEILKLEPYQQVHHLVSTVSGTLREGTSHLQALQSCYPGGSITGAPKKRAMEIIEELEPVTRGVYTGAIGYLGFNGSSQFNIAIRTIVRDHDKIHYHVGAGIVADSEPAAEFQETLHKAKGIQLALDAYQAGSGNE